MGVLYKDLIDVKNKINRINNSFYQLIQKKTRHEAHVDKDFFV